MDFTSCCESFNEHTCAEMVTMENGKWKITL